MRKSMLLLGVVATVILLATSASAANRGVSFTGVGFISGPVCVNGTNAGAPCTTNADCPGQFGRCQVPASQVWDMDAAGAVFLVSPSSRGDYAVLWTREGGWGAQVGSAGNMTISDSGATVMADGLYPDSNPAYLWPGVWTGGVNAFDPIPSNSGYAPCGGSLFTMRDFAGEGDFVTGLTWQGCSIAQGFLYDKATDTTVALGRPNGKSTRGNAVPADGSKVIGWGTNLFGNRRGATWQNGTWTFLADPDGREPKICNQSGQYCTFNGSGTNGCPEYVDDGTCANRGTCANKGTCVSNVCVGGVNAGGSCTNSNQCPGACAGGSNPGATCTSNNSCAGTCTGPSAGTVCTSNGACPDTVVCVDNPAWTNDMFKGEAYDVTADGQYACGRNFDYVSGWEDGYRANPDGTFTKLDKIETWPYIVDPFRISDNGKVIVGNAGTRLTGTVPYLWIEGVGAIDLQLFLIAQGLDELYFWYLAQASAVNADGTVIGGYGFNPDNWLEGWIVDISKLWVCHVPPGSPEGARTLGIELGSAADHVAHGDFLGTCEFMNSGSLSRATATRDQLANTYKAKFTQGPVNDASSAWDLPTLKTAPVKGKAKKTQGPRPKISARD